MILGHLDEPVSKHCLVEQVLGTLDIIAIGLLNEVRVTICVDSNLKVFTLSGVEACRVNCIFKQFETVVDCVEGIEIGARDICFEAGLAKLMARDCLLDSGCNFIVHQIGVDLDILHLQVHDDIESGELDFGAKSFASIKHCEHKLWYNDRLRVHFLLPDLLIEGTRWQLRSDCMPISEPKGFQTASNRIRVAEFCHDRSLVLFFVSFFTFFVGLSRGMLGLHLVPLSLHPGGKLVEHLLGQWKVLTLEELGHLIIDEITGVIETSFSFNDIEHIVRIFVFLLVLRHYVGKVLASQTLISDVDVDADSLEFTVETGL